MILAIIIGIAFITMGCEVVIDSATTSFTADGYWSNRSSSVCKTMHLCTPTKHTWVGSHRYTVYNDATGCDALLHKGVTKIMFYGDSYMRHIYAAMLITLNGNYKSGSLGDPDNDKQCYWDKQFSDKGCGVLHLNHVGKVCDGRIHLDPLLIGMELDSCKLLDHDCQFSKGTVSLWSFGNHPIQHGRVGVNNATEYQRFFKGTGHPFTSHICRTMKKARKFSGSVSANDSCSLWWVSTHARLRSYFGDEKPEVVEAFNREMRGFFDSGQCGHVNYVDVYNMTARLVGNRSLADVVPLMTYDGVHWGMQINLIKAQIILNAIISSA